MNIQLAPYLTAFMKQHSKSIKDWIAAEYHGKLPPIYASVDVRNSGFKVVPVDTNLFPAGFNNLDEKAEIIGSLEFKRFKQVWFPHTARILLVPENFTRNIYYLNNLSSLQRMLSSDGVDVRIGSFSEQQVLDASHGACIIYPVQRIGDGVYTKDGWSPDLIILNNDLSAGLLDELDGLKHKIIPEPHHGWYNRKKHRHFEVYNALLERFAKDFNIDPWFFSVYTKKCQHVSFKASKGLEPIVVAVEEMLCAVREKYKEYNIDSEPYAFIKPNNGTFGLAIMTVKSGYELLKMNKKMRHSMDVIRSGISNNEVIVQEGIPTIHTHLGAVAENIAYLINARVVSFITRVNKTKDQFGNLNAVHATFFCNQQYGYGSDIEDNNIESCVAQLATLATLYE